VEELFSGRHFDQEIIVLCVRWYLNFKLSYRDLAATMGERGIGLAHTTILRWVQHYTPEFAKRWQRYARPVGGSWRCDETYIKVKGIWVYLYRAVDKAGKTVDFYLSRKRDVAAAKAFLRKAMRRQRTPTKITLDAYAASHRAVADLKASGELPRRVKVRSTSRNVLHAMSPLQIVPLSTIARCSAPRKTLKSKPLGFPQIQSRIEQDTVQGNLEKGVMLCDSVPGHHKINHLQHFPLGCIIPLMHQSGGSDMFGACWQAHRHSNSE
jgi:transposase-like protein